MKKALSIILALTLAFSLLPTFAFAAETETTVTETTETAVPIKFTVDLAAYTSTFSDERSTGTDGRWYILAGDDVHGANWKVIKDESVSTVLGGTRDAAVQHFTSYLPVTITEDYITSGMDTLAFEVTAETAGIYTVAVIGRSGKNGTYFSASVNGVDDIVKGNLNTTTTGITGGKEVSCVSEVPVVLKQGANVVKIKQTEVGQNAYFRFEFTPSTVTTVDSVELSKNNYEIGETFLPGASFTAGGQTVSDPEGNSVVAVELTSSNEKVVKCSDSAFIALDEGTAELTAKISVNGTESEVVNLGAVTVSPASEAKDFTLDFAKRLSTVDDLYFHTDNGYYYFWYTTNKFYGSNWVGSAEKDESTLLNSPR